MFYVANFSGGEDFSIAWQENSKVGQPVDVEETGIGNLNFFVSNLALIDSKMRMKKEKI